MSTAREQIDEALGRPAIRGDEPVGCVDVRDRIMRALKPTVDAAVEVALAEVVADNVRLRAENDHLRAMLGHLQAWGG